MRPFNKIHVIALPRCATVSLCEALGILGKIYGEHPSEHYNTARLIHLYEQIAQDEFQLDILRECDGLADYPACIAKVYQALDEQYPGSLFINVRRDRDVQAWLQSAEQQFIGLRLIKERQGSLPEAREFNRVMAEFRRMTFGTSDFDAEAFRRAYHRHQQEVRRYFSGREEVLLDVVDVSLLRDQGFDLLCGFLRCAKLSIPFPCNNEHSEAPKRAFFEALRRGEIRSQTGLT